MLIQIENANLQGKAQVQVHIKILLSFVRRVYIYLELTLYIAGTGDEVSS